MVPGCKAVLWPPVPFVSQVVSQGKAGSLVPVSCVLKGNLDPMVSEEWDCYTTACPEASRPRVLAL